MFLEKSPNPHLTQDDVPLSLEQMLAREAWMMTDANWREDHSVPSAGEHYRYLWKWDSYKGIVINARRDDPDRARAEFETMERYREQETGFMPNKIFATTGGKKTWMDYPEAWNFNDNEKGSSYSQPSLAAWAALETYRSFERAGRTEDGLEFLRDALGTAKDGKYTGLQGEHAYFINHRQNTATDRLIGVVHPNETGRDSDQANKPWLLDSRWDSLARKYLGPVGLDGLKEWYDLQLLGRRLGKLGADPDGKRIDWIPEEARGEYWVNDVMFNSMHAANMRHIAEIAEILRDSSSDIVEQNSYGEMAEQYREIAGEVEQEILRPDRMWDQDHGFFYNLDRYGKRIEVDSITGLFPMMLEGISYDQFVSLLDKMVDKEWFGTPYPIPTHAARSKFYDPDANGLRGIMTPPWSGPVWTDANMILVEEGIVPRALELLEHEDPEVRKMARVAIEVGVFVADSTQVMLVGDHQTRECYSSRTGKGIRVRDFMWTNLGLHFEGIRAMAQKHLQ